VNKAIADIVDERLRQIDVEEWTPEHDDSHIDGSLALVAACYAAPKRIYEKIKVAFGFAFVDPWPWPSFFRGNEITDCTKWNKKGKTRRRQLVIAGALIVAEIERLDRKAEKVPAKTT
jgi:hypothetical protein